MKELQRHLKLCLITHIKDKSISEYLNFIEEAVKGGVTMVQLREKNSTIPEIKKKAIALQNTLKPHGIPLIINDFVELAAEINADGVHLGQQDMNIVKSRQILGPGKIIGLSIESIKDLNIANSIKEIDYVTASAVFPSNTKKDCKKIWGLNGLESFTSQSKHPVTAIGGINSENAHLVLKTNVSGIAVISAIHDAAAPSTAASELIASTNIR